MKSIYSLQIKMYCCCYKLLMHICRQDSMLISLALQTHKCTIKIFVSSETVSSFYCVQPPLWLLPFVVGQPHWDCKLVSVIRTSKIKSFIVVLNTRFHPLNMKVLQSTDVIHLLILYHTKPVLTSIIVLPPSPTFSYILLIVFFHQVNLGSCSHRLD